MHHLRLSHHGDRYTTDPSFKLQICTTLCAAPVNEKLAHVVAATNLAVEMPPGTETGIRHDAFSRRRAYLTLASSTLMSRSNPAGEHSPDGRCSPALLEDNVMLTFYDVPFRRNFWLPHDVSCVKDLRSRMTEKSVMRQSLFQLRMFIGASVEVCHDVA